MRRQQNQFTTMFTKRIINMLETYIKNIYSYLRKSAVKHHQGRQLQFHFVLIRSYQDIVWRLHFHNQLLSVKKIVHALQALETEDTKPRK